MDNEKLAKELEACQSNEEILKVLADNGINVTAEEMDEFVKKLRTQENGELGEDALEDVAGGLMISPTPLIPIGPIITKTLIKKLKSLMWK